MAQDVHMAVVNIRWQSIYNEAERLSLQSTCVRPQEDSGHSLPTQLRVNVGLPSCDHEFNSTSTMFPIPDHIERMGEITIATVVLASREEEKEWERSQLQQWCWQAEKRRIPQRILKGKDHDIRPSGI
ncbi:hypothetical protein QE152_g3644 [Popillia japonica]|uniref:Uncharacterized protein n=1 Tax=Popillia japonica TaxID=7064 RepID=A0AAW1MZL6_POPJA